MATALTLAQRLATGPTQAIRSTKVFINKILRETAKLVLDMSLALEKHCFATADHKEAIQAFGKKREPKFTRHEGDVGQTAPRVSRTSCFLLAAV